jgi:Holliday junction resolvase RusA-like endonuclease
MKPLSGSLPPRSSRKTQLRKAIFLRRPLVPEAQFTLFGQLPSGKNQQGVDPVHHHHYPNRRFSEWRERALRQLPKCRLEGALTLYADYYPGDERTRDVSGVLDALFHLFEKGFLVWNDSQVKNVTWRTMPVDRKAPRIHICITVK